MGAFSQFILNIIATYQADLEILGNSFYNSLVKTGGGDGLD